MIRDATEADIPWIMELGREFADAAGVTAQVGWDDASVRELLEHLIEDDDGILLVGERGMIGGLVFPHQFNRAVRVFQEVFWRSEGFEGVKLLKAALTQAEAKGATRFLMIDAPQVADTAGLYRRMGFEPAERIYTKGL